MSIKIRLYGLVEDSIVDGPGLRLGIFLQGCLHNCFGCHNPDSHALDGGYLEGIDVIIKKAINNPLCSGVTFSGGEPLLQIPEVLIIAKQLKSFGKHLMLYTGFTFEDLLKRAELDLKLKELLTYLDVLVDGQFVQELKTLSLPFRGSSNQRMIDVKSTLEQGKIIEISSVLAFS